MLDFKDCKETNLNGKIYDFSGVHVIIGFDMKIEKVTCLKTGSDLTQEYKIKYGE